MHVFRHTLGKHCFFGDCEGGMSNGAEIRNVRTFRLVVQGRASVGVRAVTDMFALCSP